MASLRRDLGVLAAKMAHMEIEVPSRGGGAKLAKLEVEEEVPSRDGGAKLNELEVGPGTEQDARQQVWQVEESHISVSPSMVHAMFTQCRCTSGLVPLPCPALLLCSPTIGASVAIVGRWFPKMWAVAWWLIRHTVLYTIYLMR